MADLFVSFEYDLVPANEGYLRSRGNIVMPWSRPILDKAEIEAIEYAIDTTYSRVGNVTVLDWRRMEEPEQNAARELTDEFTQMKALAGWREKHKGGEEDG